jgi:hypothetical protein
MRRSARIRSKKPSAVLMPTQCRQAARHTSPKLKRLVAVCYHLQLSQGNSPFFLGVRATAKIGGAKGLPQASAWLWIQFELKPSGP